MRKNIPIVIVFIFFCFLFRAPPVFAQSNPPSITAITPSTFSQGDLVEISGTNFGQNFPANDAQICFALNLCSTPTSFPSILRAWSNEKITIQIPNWDIPETGELLVVVQPEVAQPPSLVKFPFTFLTKRSSILEVSPAEAIVRETVVTIKGKNLGSQFEKGKDQYCLGNSCLKDEVVDAFIVSWSDTEVKVKVFLVQSTDPVPITIVKFRYPLLFDNSAVYDVVKTAPIKVILQKDPEVTSITPLTIIPGQTILTITGAGFESEYKPGFHQLCFQTLCMKDDDRSIFVQSWSNTQIQLKVPFFVSQFDNATFSMSALFPNRGTYSLIFEKETLIVKKAPFVEQFYPKMQNGKSYSILGRNFGENKGKVFLGIAEAQVEQWSTSQITFKAPEIAGPVDLIIEDSDRIRSFPISVEIMFQKRFSQDPFSYKQTYLENIRIPESWRISEGSSQIVVAVIDSGVDRTHEDLQGIFWVNPKEISGNNFDDDGNGFIDDVSGWDFVANSNNELPVNNHGTMVASVIAAKKDNQLGLSGVAPHVKIMPLNVVKKMGATMKEDKITVGAVQSAIKYAVDNGAHIINLSFGGTPTDAYTAVLEYAYQNNVLVVAASGNDRKDLDAERVSPVCNDAAANVVIGVAAVTPKNTLSEFSNFGNTCIDISAPGSDIVVAVPPALNEEKNSYSLAGGTSFAAPVVAGVAALIKSAHPDWNVEEIKTVLFSTAVSIESFNPTFQGKMGRGLIDVYAALTASRPSVSYQFTPRRNLVMEKSNEVVGFEKPEVKVIKEEEMKKISDSAVKPEGEKKVDEVKKTEDPPKKVLKMKEKKKTAKERRLERLKKQQERRERLKKQREERKALKKKGKR